MEMKRVAKTLAYWLLPCAFHEALENYDYRSIISNIRYRPQFAANRVFRDRHRGERCFILCNGPSVGLQELTPLRGEVVFSVSNGYHHKDYQVIRPRYHCVPQITYGALTQDDVIAWFREMDDKAGDAELFVSSSELELIQKYHLFPRRKVNYLCLGGRFAAHNAGIIDLAGIIPKVMSIPIMCLMIAMYMGFKSIYLLGTEHNSFATGEYKYFYEPTVLKGKDAYVSSAGKRTNSMYDELRANLELWSQYRALKQIAVSNGISIFNATQGGLLDEFERVTLSEILVTRGSK